MHIIRLRPLQCMTLRADLDIKYAESLLEYLRGKVSDNNQLLYTYAKLCKLLYVPMFPRY